MAVSIVAVWRSVQEAFLRRLKAGGGKVGAGSVRERGFDVEDGNLEVPLSFAPHFGFGGFGI